MSNRFVYKIILFLAVMLPFTACDSIIYDQPVEEEVNGPKVYLSVSIQAARTGELRTINEFVNFEDRVHDLALLVFDSATGVKVGQFFGEGIAKERTNYTFTVELTPGERDFYFVANMPMAALKAIDDRTAMNTYMKTFTVGALNRNLDTGLYLSATDSEGFPMSRVYTNQQVTEGGTPYQPKAFKPVVEGVENNDVRLFRVVAKLEVDFGSGISQIENVYYKNAFRQFSLMSPVAPQFTPMEYYTVTPANANGNPLKSIGNTFVYYMPEALMNNPSWGTGSHEPVNYFVIETKSGTKYNIPIITNDNIPNDETYMKVATGNSTTPANYNIYRNHHYYYTVGNLETIEINYQVNPWEKVNKKLYMGYGYYVEIEDGKVKITNTVDACAPHKVTLKGINGTKINGVDTYDYTNPNPGASSPEYELTGTPSSGGYLEVYYNEDAGNISPVYTFSK